MHLAAIGATPPAPWTTERMQATVRAQLADEGAAAVRHQPWNGIPYKVYAAEAGRAGATAPADDREIGVAAWTWETAQARTLRNWAVAAVFTADGARGVELARRMRSGMTSVNAVLAFVSVPGLPFGGVGESGFGRVHGEDGLKEFTRAKSITRQRYAMPRNLLSFSRSPRATTSRSRISARNL